LELTYTGILWQFSSSGLDIALISSKDRTEN